MLATSRRTFVASSFVACALLFACSSSSSGGGAAGDGGSGSGSGGGSSSGSSGSSSGGQALPPADAFVAATVGPGADAVKCPDLTFMPSFALGTATPDKPTTVVNGGAVGSGTATITCIVRPQGSGFDVSLSASVGGRSFTVQSPAGEGAVQSNGGIGLTTTFSDATGTYQGNPCTLSYVYMSAPVPVNPPVAAGRIWGHLSCPAAQVQGQAGVQCDTEADFLFEQCTQ